MQLIRFIPQAILLLPLLEILAFIIAGAVFGILPALSALLATTALGVFILRKYQWLTVQRMQQQLRAGYLSTETVAQDGFVILAGILLIIPGFITDILGLFCLIPAVRSGLFKKLLAVGWIKEAQKETHNERGPRIIEGEAHRIDENNQ